MPNYTTSWCHSNQIKHTELNQTIALYLSAKSLHRLQSTRKTEVNNEDTNVEGQLQAASQDTDLHRHGVELMRRVLRFPTCNAAGERLALAEVTT